MTPVEEVEAAIAKLTTLKDTSTPGDWFLTYESATHPRVWGNASLDSLDADHVATTARSAIDAELIVALHRTIDAQLAVLNESLEFYANSKAIGMTDSEMAEYYSNTITLAKAINGSVS